VTCLFKSLTSYKEQRTVFSFEIPVRSPLRQQQGPYLKEKKRGGEEKRRRRKEEEKRGGEKGRRKGEKKKFVEDAYAQNITL
jgi:hypothetical protein